MRRNYHILGLLFLVFFLISLLTNIIGPIIPDIIDSFGVSMTMAALLPFSFFIAYGVMSIPAGLLVEKFGEKLVMIAAFAVSMAGSLSFALVPRYGVAVCSLFGIGIGMAMLQVAINPLLRTAGGEENFAFNEALAQLVFGSASFLSPRIYSYLVQNLERPAPGKNLLLRTLATLTPTGLPWVSMYWIFAVSTATMVLVLSFSRLPQAKRELGDEAGSSQTYSKLFRKPVVWLFFAGIFAYVGSEQGVADWISKFLEQYHGFDPHTTGAMAVSWFWGLMTAGCFLGLVLLKLFDSRKVLICFSVGAILCLTAALFGPSQVSVIAFPAIGLFASVMWPILVSLALNSVSEHHGSLAGILTTGIMGGAIVPLIIGRIGDYFGLRAGVSFLYLTLGYVLSVGFWAKPIVTNATINLRKTEIPAST